MPTQAFADANGSATTPPESKKKKKKNSRQPKSSISMFDTPVQPSPTTRVFGMNGKSEFCTVIVPEKVNASQLEGLNRQPIVAELHTGCAQSRTPAFCIPEPVGRSASSLPRVPYITQVRQDSLHIIGAPSSSHQPSTPPAATHPQAVAGAVDSQSLFPFNPPPTQIPSLLSVPREVVPSSSLVNFMAARFFQTQDGRTQKLEGNLSTHTSSLCTSTSATSSKTIPATTFQSSSLGASAGTYSGMSAAYMKGDCTIYSPQDNGKFPNLGVQASQSVQRQGVQIVTIAHPSHFQQQVRQPNAWHSVVDVTSTPRQQTPMMPLHPLMTPPTLPAPPSTHPSASIYQHLHVDTGAPGTYHHHSFFNAISLPSSLSGNLPFANSTTPFARAEELSRQVQQAARERWVDWLQRLEEVPRTNENMQSLQDTIDQIHNSLRGLQVPFAQESIALLGDLIHWIQTTEGEEAVHILEEQLRMYAANNEEFIVKIAKRLLTELKLGGKRFLGVVFDTPVTTGSVSHLGPSSNLLSMPNPPTLPSNCLLVLRKAKVNTGVTQRKASSFGGLILRCGDVDCSYCSKTKEGEVQYWRTKQDALEHFSTCLLEGKNPWKCPACPTYIKTKENLCRHMDSRHHLSGRSRTKKEAARSPGPRDISLTSCHTPASSTHAILPVAHHHQQSEEQTSGGWSRRSPMMSGSRLGGRPYPLRTGRSPRTHPRNSIPPSSPLLLRAQIPDVDAARFVAGGEVGVAEDGWGSSGWPLSPQTQRHVLDYAQLPHATSGWSHNLEASALWKQIPLSLSTTFNNSTQSTDQPVFPLPPTVPLPPSTAGSYDTLPGQASAAPNLSSTNTEQDLLNEFLAPWQPDPGNPGATISHFLPEN